MAVYVDNMRAKLGRMFMSHMLADTTVELLAMMDAIGVARRWLQDANTASEHCDVSLSKRRSAIEHGARPVSTRVLVELIRAKRLTRMQVAS